MELVTARGARLCLEATPQVRVPTGFRKGRGPLGALVMCRLTLERPGCPLHLVEAPVARLGEAHRLADWLAAVAAGDVRPMHVPGAPALRFHAPFLALDLAALDEGAATFRVHLAAPAPGQRVSDVHDLVASTAPLTVTRPRVAAAAAAWRTEIPTLPEEA